MSGAVSTRPAPRGSAPKGGAGSSDGSVARSSGKVTPFGSFIDSVADRYSDIFALGGLVVYYCASSVLPAVLLSLAGSIMVSYTRARAEGLGATCRVGMMQRPERIVLLGLGAVFSSVLFMLRGTLGLNAGPYLLGLVLVLIAVLANYTAFARNQVASLATLYFNGFY